MVPMLTTLVLGCSPEFAILEDEPREQVDRYAQESASQTDVLFVVDNSESMKEEQALLATNFPSFLEWFENFDVDYHIGVISTDMDDPTHSGLLRGSQGTFWLEPGTPDAANIFAELTLVGTTGSSDERGREAAYSALELRGAANAGFRRDDAFLNVVVVSDEDDQSDDTRISRTEFVRYLRDLQTESRRTTFSAIVGPASFQEAGACEASPGFEYLEVVGEVGGVAWSICDADWSPLLDELGFVSVGLRRTFRLSYNPDRSTLTVYVDDIEVPENTWVYEPETNDVRFLGEPPPTGSEVTIEYVTFDDP